MRRAGSTRASSPTNTTYSGISNYRTDSYRPLKDNPQPYPPMDPRMIARTHFEELTRYLASYLAKEPANSRSTARQKLTRLTRQQFQELSTDVYDELLRRKNNTTDNEGPSVPFLPVRDDFHPKRNQARQKLATLPTGRFKDLSSDVYYELARRYPEFKEEMTPESMTSPASAYDDYPSPDFPTSPRSKPAVVASPASRIRTSEDKASDSVYSVSPLPPYPGRPSEDAYGRRRPSEDDYSNKHRSEDPYAGVDSYPTSPPPSTRRKPSTDIRRPSQDTTREVAYGRRPSESISMKSDSSTNAQSATAGMGMVIPNKSTIAEEEIEVPYGREARDSSSTAMDERTRDRSQDMDRDRDKGRETDTDMEGESDLSARSPPTGGLGGLNGLSARLQETNGGDDDEAGGRSGDDYFDKMSYGRASVTSDRSARLMGGRQSVGGDDSEKMRREYEYKVATMQSRIVGLERDLADAQQRERFSESDDRVRIMEEELGELRRRAEEKAFAMQALQQELDNLREEHAREKEREVRRTREDEEELQILRNRCEQLESERTGSQAGPEILDQLRSDMEGLISELSDLSRRNDELMTAKDADLVVIRDLDSQLKEYKRKYEQAKTELRSIKATSQLFLQAPKTDTDQLPMSPDGGILDIHITAFLSAIDGLLTAGRSNAPTRVLTPMKAVINAVTAIVEDVRVYERRSRHDLSEADQETLHALRDRVEATLSNLVAVSKTHATSSGLAPVSLLDAAASHVSLTVTEISKIVHIRKATKADQDQFSAQSNGSANNYSPLPRAVDETRSASHQRGTSSASSRRGEEYSSRLSESVSPSVRAYGGRPSVDEQRRRPPSNPSSSDRSSPPPIFDQATLSNNGGIVSDDSTAAEGPEDAWAELKPYLQAQSESVVFAIQSVLSGVRSPTPSPTLNENLTQIITIVSSIVAVCKDSLPEASAPQGMNILRELSEHANKLSEVQALPEVTKDSRQVMARSSFAVANAMKALTKL